jgi:carbamoyltransferase
MQKDLNMKVKYRESFRPFAPAVLLEDLEHWFDLNIESPYMLFIADVKKSIQIHTTEVDKKDLFGLNLLNKKRSIIPAVTHIDYSARIQTVNKKENILFYNLIKEFKKITGVPVLINTSFNIRGEPIVCSVKDAYDCFMGTNLDILVVNNFILYKHHQTEKISYEYKSKYKLD